MWDESLILRNSSDLIFNLCKKKIIKNYKSVIDTDEI